MRFSPALVSGVLATAAKALQSGSSSSDSDDWTNNSTKPIELVPAPWALHGTVYSLATLLPPATLPAKAYGPLERASPAYVGAAEYVGLLGMIQIIRYTDSPVGPYDELLLVPGYFKYPHVDAEGRQTERLNPSITRIYVSQKYTAKNGRLNWNIPKHLAKFDWTESADGSTTVKVYPFDTVGGGPDAAREPGPAALPFFQTTFTPALGGLPFSTDLYQWIGINATLAQPPLPGHADSAHGELAGTDRWRAVVPGQASARSSLGLFDMDQGRGDQVGDTGRNAVGDEFFPNFWPNTPRLTLGLRMDNAKISFGEPEIWG
ncbi:Ras-related protein Rab-6A [Apiospora arundinis]